MRRRRGENGRKGEGKELNWNGFIRHSSDEVDHTRNGDETEEFFQKLKFPNRILATVK